MTSITIALDDARVARLRQLAEQRGETVEQVVQSLLTTLIPSLPDVASGASFGSTLDLAGAIDGPSVRPLTAREIDDILAEEAGGARAAE